MIAEVEKRKHGKAVWKGGKDISEWKGGNV